MNTRIDTSRQTSDDVISLRQRVAELEQTIAQQRLADAALRERQVHFQTLYEDTPAMAFVLSMDGTILSLNRYGAEQLGYTPEELVGQSVLQIFDPADYHAVLRQLTVCGHTSDSTMGWELQKVRKDGSRLWVRETARTIRDAAGSPTILVVCEDITTRKTAEEELRVTAQKLQALIHACPLAVMSLDNESETVTLWNPAAEAMFGWHADETLGRPTPFLPPSQYCESGHMWDDLITSGAVSGVEFRRVRKDGIPIDISLWATVLKNELGTVTDTIGFLADITARKQVEASLRESEQAIRALQETISRPALTFDQRIQAMLELGCRRFKLPIGLVTRVEGKSLVITHVSSQETHIVAGTVLPLNQTYCHATLTAEEPVCFEQASASEWRNHHGYTTLEIECYIGTKLVGLNSIHGTICFVAPAPYATRFTDADKDFLLLMAQWIGHEQDRQESERALKQQESLLRAVIDTATDAIFMKDTNGRYRLINAAGAKTIGKPVEEVIGKTDQELFPSETAKRLMENDQQVLIGGSQHHFEAVIPFQGEPRTFSSIKTPHRDPQGNVIGLVGVSRDITDQKLLEEQRSKSERLFASFMENLPGLAWIKDTAGRYVYLNGAFERAFDVKLVDWKGKTDFEVWPRPVANQFTANDRQVLSTNAPILTVETAPQADGNHASLVSKFPIPNEQGSPILVGGVAVDITERKQAEEALRLTQFAVDRAADLAFWIDREARFAYVNDAACQRLGYTRHELLSMTVADVDPNYQTESWPQHWETLRRTGQLRFETMHRTKTGELYPVEVVANYATFEGKEYNFAFSRDISEQKRAEAALRDSEARWKTLFEHAGVGIAQLSLTGQFLRVNARLCQTLGYSSKTLCQHSFHEIIHPDDLALNLRLLDELMTSTRPSFSMEKRYRRSDGVWLWATSTVSLVRSTSGTPTYFIKVIEDISERKQAEEALQQSEARLHRFVADAPVGLVIMDAQKRILSANKAFCALTGYTESEIIGSTYALYTHPDDLPENLVLTDEFFQGKRSGYAHEKRYVRKPGDTIWVAVKTTSTELPGHVGPLLLAVVEDITERKQAMDERERISQDLHDDVLQSLYAVGMGLEATKSRLKPISRSTAKRLEGSVAQLNGVIHEVRSFIPRMQKSSRTDGSFEQALRSLVGSFTATGAGDIAITIDAAASAALPLDHCRDVISIAKEAISNSLRHAKARRRTITFHRHRSTLRLEITDNGRGFQPSRSRKGLGLSNMRTRAKKLGARLKIDSAPGQGTRIIMDLPVR